MPTAAKPVQKSTSSDNQLMTEEMCPTGGVDNQTTKKAKNNFPTITQDEEEEQQQPTSHCPRTRATRLLTDEFIYNMMELRG